MKVYPKQEWIRVGVLLALAGGMLDAYTFLWRGEVLATAETGNIVMMGLCLAQGDWHRAGSYIFPISAFALGILVAEIIRHKMEVEGNRPQWRRMILLAEVLLIAIVTMLPLGSGDPITNVTISFVSAIQVGSFRSFRGCPAFTTMCTGNLRSVSDHLSRFLLTGEQEAREKMGIYLSIIAAFFAGVLLCNGLSLVIAQYAILVATLPLLAAYGMTRGN